jgi:hypothetical protein
MGNTFLTHAPVGGVLAKAEFGINGGWGGIRTTSAFVDKFDANTTDTRGQFYKMGKGDQRNWRTQTDMLFKNLEMLM